MKHQLILHMDGLPVPLGFRNWSVTPEVGTQSFEMVGNKMRRVEIVAVTFFPAIPSRTFADDEAWVACRLV